MDPDQIRADILQAEELYDAKWMFRSDFMPANHPISMRIWAKYGRACLPYIKERMQNILDHDCEWGSGSGWFLMGIAHQLLPKFEIPEDERGGYENALKQYIQQINLLDI